MATEFASASSTELIEQLKNNGVKVVRVTYPDMHGYMRGKDIPIHAFNDVIQSGISFCIANLVDDLSGNPLDAPGMAPDRGFPDMRARPDVATLVPVPWEADTVQCIADLFDGAEPVAHSPRHLLKRAVEEVYTALKLKPVVAHELEFFLLEKTEEGWKRYSDRPAMVYTIGRRSDERGVIRAMLQAGEAMGLGLTAGNHEFAGGQFEINMRHGFALESADRAFRFKNMVKEVAAEHGLLATFMGKPFNDITGSGYHLHLSLVDEHGENRFFDPGQPDQLSQTMKHFIGGILTHAPALMAFLSPNINAYKRFVPDSLVPLAVNWGYDNRTTFIRVPPEREGACRLEMRAGDAAANPYLITAVILWAGLDGIEKGIDPGEALQGNLSSPQSGGNLLPRSLEESLHYLNHNQTLINRLGQSVVNAYTAMKEAELERFRTYVTDWEFNEYAFHL